ncbi:MAG: Mur ligase family protein [Candidatus Gracilibacteria bacterium]|nr:Mur ligase family protein [Candidatus Gracilibacteria bacterium]
MITTYKEALKYIFTDKILPYNQQNLIKANSLLGNPLKDIKVIHIAGTNGKGSVSKMVFSVLKEANKSVGVFTNPFIIDKKERFLTDKGYINETEFITLTNKIKELPLTLARFERGTLLAFLFFKLKKVEFAIIEVGLGGRLDPTNIVNPYITCITSISLDHQDILGKTKKEISYEKAGIIKENIPIFINHKNKVIEEIAKQKNAKLIYTDTKKETNLLGNHQQKNAGLAYEMCKYLKINENTILSGLKKVNHIGRLQFIKNNLLIDGAHNEEGINALKEYLKNITDKYDDIYYCIQLKKGKKLNLITNIIGKNKKYILINKKNKKLKEQNKLLEEFQKQDINTQILTPRQIITQASKKENYLYVIFGSLYVLGDFIELS